MGLASGLIRVQLYLAKQFVLLFDFENWCVLHMFVVHTVLLFTACCYSSRYFLISGNEPEVLPVGLLPL